MGYSVEILSEATTLWGPPLELLYTYTSEERLRSGTVVLQNASFLAAKGYFANILDPRLQSARIPQEINIAHFGS